MRVLYDISTLGLGHLYQQSRGGSFRADLHLAEALAGSGECELLFCANHSTVAYRGSQAFLRGHARLAGISLVAGQRSQLTGSLRAAAAVVHRSIRGLVGSNVLPAVIRDCAVVVDRRLHPPVADAATPVDVFHSPATPLPARRTRSGPPRFLTIHDLAYARFPDLYPPAFQRSIESALRSLRPEDRVITSSVFVRDELCERGVAPRDRIQVVPLAADPALFYRVTDAHAIAVVRSRYRIPDGPYILSVNSPDPRKNVAQAVHAFARAAQDGGAAVGSLVLTGGSGPGEDRIRQAIACYPQLRARIVVTGYVPDEELAPLYSGAQIFVFPSIYEGFGLPPLEAMQCGTPVIATNTSAIPEVVADAGVIVEAGRLDAFAAAILEIALDAARHASLQGRALLRARQFSWERTAAATLQAYRTALSG